MPPLNPQKQREFAVEVVRRLRAQGFEAYWAGGCVRDQLLGRTPYDYDVATSARPDEIRNVFRDRHTLAIGAAFGVITVIGPRGAGQIEVTTFREDAQYRDGRHPDHVSFSSPEEDAKRRDFTINGMFYDPLAEQIVDLVSGEVDVRQGIVRAIGDPRQRFTEDKLRMLRAVRFAAVFDFHLEDATRAAIAEMADQVTVVSAERIAAEMRIALASPGRVRAAELLRTTGLLRPLLPEVANLPEPAWQQTLAVLSGLKEATFPLALAALVHRVELPDVAETIGERWRLARKETERLAWLLSNKRALVGANALPWSRLQRLLVAESRDDLIELHEAQAQAGAIDRAGIDYCRTQLQRPPEELNPPPLLVGQDLINLGIPRGPAFAKLLRAARDAQLDGLIGDHEAALALIERLWREKSAG